LNWTFLADAVSVMLALVAVMLFASQVIKFINELFRRFTENERSEVAALLWDSHSASAWGKEARNGEAAQMSGKERRRSRRRRGTTFGEIARLPVGLLGILAIVIILLRLL
jgi:hypothetical protein